MIVSSSSMPGCLFGTFLLLKENDEDSLIIADVLKAAHFHTVEVIQRHENVELAWIEINSLKA